ncbi:lytic transglycosylase domain-containing protein [Marilutibacter chinensis]|uniref:Transglycosylase SLT domain-containing protein n=1 Tax=Marilutibacter chinensis TaxID=2912247 RepID=A0ABS9HX44_9GAMM|nr:lytic transglycosylase domain-containing protein [Lysobacter chinensis]MCF7223450.1 transglycosylase SLT domain-containing protein [Lysobacter chinensis]
MSGRNGRRAGCRLAGLAALLLASSAVAHAADGPAGGDTATGVDGATAAGTAATDAGPAQPAGTRNGREIFDRFRDGLADPQCEADTSARWSRHFAHAPDRLATPGDGLLPLFGYVVDALRDSHLPTEYALIPFIESGYKPGARSPAGPVGMWQMVQVTARNHKVPVGARYDGRLSPVDSTRAAVRYLKTLHGMFAGDWRLAVMAYNAGEYRVLGALRRGGVAARDAEPEQLPGMPGITQAYVRKIHALSCLMLEASEDEAWLQALDRPVPRLQAIPVPDDVRSVAQYADRAGQDPGRLQRLNPVYASGRIHRPNGRPAYLLAPASGIAPAAIATSSEPETGTTVADASAIVTAAESRQHVVVRGDNPWTIARRYGLRVGELLSRNGLTTSSVLQPGQRLQVGPAPEAGTAATTTTVD